MKTPVSVADNTRNPAEFLARVENEREHFVIINGDQAIAELRPCPGRRMLSELPDVLSSLPLLAEGDTDGFAHDGESARRGPDAIPVDDP